MLNKHLLWNDVIESDGRIVREETFLGAAIATVLLGIILGILVVVFI